MGSLSSRVLTGDSQASTWLGLPMAPTTSGPSFHLRPYRQLPGSLDCSQGPLTAPGVTERHSVPEHAELPCAPLCLDRLFPSLDQPNPTPPAPSCLAIPDLPPPFPGALGDLPLLSAPRVLIPRWWRLSHVLGDGRCAVPLCPVPHPSPQCLSSLPRPPAWGMLPASALASVVTHSARAQGWGGSPFRAVVLPGMGTLIEAGAPPQR